MLFFTYFEKFPWNQNSNSPQASLGGDCSPAYGRPRGSKDQVDLAPDPDRLKGALYPSLHACSVHPVLLQEPHVRVVVAGRGGGAEFAFRPLASQAVDEVGEVLAHATTRVKDERHASADLAVCGGLRVLLDLVLDALVDDAMRVDVGVMHDVELASDEVPHRHMSQLPVTLDGACRETGESNVRVNWMAVRTSARTTHLAADEACNTRVSGKLLERVRHAVKYLRTSLKVCELGDDKIRVFQLRAHVLRAPSSQFSTAEILYSENSRLGTILRNSTSSPASSPTCLR